MLKHEVEKRALVFKGKSCPNNKLPRRHFDEGRTALNAPASLTLKREQQMTRPRRSLLFMPGSNARALEKARILHADAIILDLEDSVAPEAKGLAREQIARAIAAGGFGKREVLIRTNALDTPWWSDDVRMAADARPDGILVPKVSSVEDLATIARCLRENNAPPSIQVWTMIETALAVLHAEELAAASRNVEPRLAGFVFGPNDISRETRIRMQPGRATMLPMITHCILAARAYALEILDGPYSDFSNVNGFSQECTQARDLGFDGKTLIHPGQIEACNAIFTPPAEEVARARRIIAAFELPENASRGAISLDGQMVERLHADMARRTIGIADQIADLARP
jgi:citrate lyase subunit beta / citryl-CoA lyase